MSRTALLPVALLGLCVLPLTALGWWGLLGLILPVAAAAWVLRRGVDIGPAGITPRSLLAADTLPWEDVAGIRIGHDQELWVVRATGSEVRLPVVRVRDLPRLAVLSDGRIPDPTSPA